MRFKNFVNYQFPRIKHFWLIAMLFMAVNSSYAYELIAEPEKVYGIESITNIKMSQDGSRMVSSGPFVAYVWDTASWEVIQKYKPEQQEELRNKIFTCEISADGKKLYMLSELINDSNEVALIAEIYDIETNEILVSQQEPIQTYQPSYRQVENSVFFLPNGEFYLLVLQDPNDFDFTTYLIETSTGEVIKKYETIALAISPDGKTFYSGNYLSTSFSSFLWDIETGTRIKPLPTGTLLAKFSPDGNKLFKHSGDSAEIIDVESGSILKEFDTSFEFRNEFFISPDSQKFGLSNMYNNLYKITIYDLEDNLDKEYLFDEPIASSHVSFTHDGQQFVANNYTGLSLYDSESGQELFSLSQKIDDQVSVYLGGLSFQYSSDYKKAYIYPLILDLETGQEILRFSPQVNSFQLIISDDLERQYAALFTSDDMRIYQIADPPQLISFCCGKGKATLT